MSWRNALFESASGAWTLEFWPTVLVLLVSAIYLRGFIGASRTMPSRFPWSRAVAFLTGELVVLFAIFSPLDALGGYLLSAHMVQHFLLLVVAPPLILYGAPAIPLLRGLPASVRNDWVGPFLATKTVRSIGHVLVHPITGWTSMVVATWVWHVPTLYELALVHEGWHQVEHAIFLTTAILFWFPVIQPWPSKPIWPRWTMIPYLLLADLQNTIFSAFFSFAPRVIYPVYGAVTPSLGIDPMEDQAFAGGFMWVPGSIAFLLPVAWIIRGLMRARGPEAQRKRLLSDPQKVRATRSVALPIANEMRSSRQLDLLRMPVLGPMIASRFGRHCIRFAMLALAVVVVIDGFFGPKTSAMNLAGVLPWTHWRGLAVLVLLFAGNLLCMACPFTLPRTLAGRFLPRRLNFPRVLRTKWLAVVLIIGWLWAYEVLALWDAPAATAWIIVGYFVVAFFVDAFFRGAAFCKYVCPIGQFHFVQSLVSPFQVKARDAQVCAECTTQECIRGSASVAGCGTNLFVPKKVGNLDCTFCMDCADACPKGNVGITATKLGSDLSFEGWRSSIGRLVDRFDASALLFVLVFGAFANAMGMTAPILMWQDELTLAMGFDTYAPVATGLLLFEIVLLPLVIALGLGWILRVAVGPPENGSFIRGWVGRSAMALVPLGVAMWIVHYQFHLLTSWTSVFPVTHRALLDVSGGTLESMLGVPNWSQACCAPAPDWLLNLEIVVLNLGFVFSWALAFGFVRRALPQAGTMRVLVGALPLGLVQVGLLIWGIWIILQPMQMRGTLLP